MLNSGISIADDVVMQEAVAWSIRIHLEIASDKKLFVMMGEADLHCLRRRCSE